MSKLRDIRVRPDNTYVFYNLGAGSNLTPMLVGNIEMPTEGDVYWLGEPEGNPSVYVVVSVEWHEEYIWKWRAVLKADVEQNLAIRKRREELTRQAAENATSNK